MTFKKLIVTLFLFAVTAGCITYCFISAQEDQSYLLPKTHNQAPKKVFIIDGELSGDRIAAWYLQKLKQQNPNLECEAVGEQFIAQAGAKIQHDFSEIRSGIRIASGFFNCITKIPASLDIFNQLVDYITINDFDHVILVDAPIINVPLARALKKKRSSLHITYIAPPEMWFWGTWRVDNILKQYCDKIVVIYPFETEWYKKIGLEVKWLGYPFYEEFLPRLSVNQTKENCIALLPGSRRDEIETMMPLFKSFVKYFNTKYPDASFILPLAESFTQEFMSDLLKKYGIEDKIKIITGVSEKRDALCKCCLAITKPGTITLDLALLKVPSIIMYKVSWPTYFFIKLVANPKYVGLPNIFADREICKELLQSDCTIQALTQEAEALYNTFLTKSVLYQQKLDELEILRQTFIQGWDGTKNK